MTNFYDIIIIGSGMSGLYSAYNIKKMSPKTSFVILEKHKKQWIGGRTSNEMFYGSEIVTGAGIGRRKKDVLLYKLLKELHIKTYDFTLKPNYANTIHHISDIHKTIDLLKAEYSKHYNSNSKSKKVNVTFKQFAKSVLGEKDYKQFLITTGYTDYENEDSYDTLYNYGMEDNQFQYKAFHVEWREMVLKLAEKIGMSHFKFSNDVSKVSKVSKDYNESKVSNKPCKFQVDTENGIQYYCNKVIVATTISGIRKLLPQYPIYNDIEGQPFLRLYGKFAKKSIPVMKEYVKEHGITVVPGPLQKILRINPDNGIYMISYSDNNNALALKEHLANTKENRDLFISKS